MKKTIFLFCCTAIITGMLFFSGAYLLDLVALSDNLDLGIAQSDANREDNTAAGVSDGVRIGVPGFAFFQPFNLGATDEFVSVLRAFKQDADSGEPINILVLASDENNLTDSIMVAHFNPKTSQFNMISAPRDTYVTLKGYKFHKINSVYNAKNGEALLKGLLQDMLGIKIDYYIHINLKTIREIVDMLGGVEYDVPCDMIYDDPDQNLHINLKKGRRTLTGKQVEGLLRFRHPNSNKWTKEIRKYYDGSDLKRIERQHDFFNEMLKQKLNVRYMSITGDIIDNVYSNITTDLPLTEMLKLAKGLPGLSQGGFQTAILPGYAKTIDGISYYIHSPKQSRALAEAMFTESGE
jgi:LCP family protein required for cell wall assembly